MSEHTTPEGLLAGPAPPIIVEKIDFTKTDLPASEYRDAYAVILDNVLTPSECAALVAAAEQHADGSWERALVNVGNNQQQMISEIRNCDRIIWDEPELAARLWARVAPHVPEVQRLQKWPKVTGEGPARRGESWVATRLNERLRFLRYGPEEYFRGR